MIDKNEYDGLLNLWKSANETKDYQKIIGTKKKLHLNSEEIVSILKEYDIIQDGMFVFEVGCGMGRNLAYIFNENNTINISGNDLDRIECFKNMPEEIKDEIDFLEIDSLSLFEGEARHVDLLIASDHFVHLPPSIIGYILDKIITLWKPSFILLREPTKLRNHSCKKFKHDYTILNEAYDCLYKSESWNKDANVCLFRRR